MTEIHLIVGTRPEAIKVAPLVAELHRHETLKPVVVSSGQHPAMVDQALAAFGQHADERLSLTRITGSQPELVGSLVQLLDRLLADRPPAAVVVHGDTSTTLAGALAAFWRGIPVVHLEAGLRSHDPAAPFPEEANRRLVGQLARLHLAPTTTAVANLRREGVSKDWIVLTGNTVVDAVTAVAADHALPDNPRLARLAALAGAGTIRLGLVTVHRRESWGAPLDAILSAVRDLVRRYEDLHIVLPCHPNPVIRARVRAALGGLDRILVTEPLPYPDLTRTLAAAHVVLSDSGGIQEEAPTFGVPVLVLREVTERMEAVEAGFATLVGTDPDRIRAAAAAVLDHPGRGATLPRTNPFGDGHAAERAVAALASLVR